jgi:peptidoglycan/LPS O-acetylase OafA/YrhL
VTLAHTPPAGGSAFTSPAESSTASERHLRFRPDIEGLRAVAIGMVVLYHAGWWRASRGYLGVDVFFVLSGFLITGLLVDEIAATGRVSLVRFWARRAQRLLSAAAVMTAAVLVANRVLLSPFDQIERAETGRAFAVYGSNILFALRSTNYFGGDATHDPLLHTWSLSVEEQFYLIFAPLMLVMAAWARARGFAVFRRRFLVLTAALSVVSLVGCVLAAHRYPLITFYALPARGWEFGLGALAVFTVPRAATLPRALLEALALLGVLALVASTFMLGERLGPPLGLSTLVPTLATVALILAGASARPTFVARGLSLAPMRLLGRLSYSWYLWHWPVLVYLREVAPDASTKLRVAVASLALVLAAVTYVLVESPIRFSTRLRAHPRSVVAGALAVAVLMLGAATAADRYAQHVLASPRVAGILAAKARARVYPDNCHLSLRSTASPPCRYGPGRNDTTVFLFGDSHAAHWFPALDSVAALRGWSLVSLTKSSCPSVTVVLNSMGRRYTECEEWRRKTIARIVASRPTVVVLSNRRMYDVVSGATVQNTDTSTEARREWSMGLAATLQALRPSGARLVVLEDTPQPGIDVPRCLVKYLDQPTRCDPPVTRALHPASSDAELAAVRAVAGAMRISLNRFMCDTARCPVLLDGTVRFQDDHHLSVQFAASLAPQLSQELTRVLALPREGVSAPARAHLPRHSAPSRRAPSRAPPSAL